MGTLGEKHLSNMLAEEMSCVAHPKRMSAAQALSWLRDLKKSDFMMLCDTAVKVALDAAIDQCEGAQQALTLPYASKLGPLLSTLLAGALYWIVHKQGDGKELFGAEAAKAKFILCMKSANKPPPAPQVMGLAPWCLLLEDDQQTEIRKWIGDLAKAGTGLKRLGTKQSLGLVKAKTQKIIAKAVVSSASGSSMKLDLFEL